MAYVKKSDPTELQMMLKDIEHGYLYFKQNYVRYNQFMRFVFKTNIEPSDASVNLELDKPNMEFNILEAFLSRLCGEFSKMDPAFTVRGKEGVKLMNPDVIELVEAHLKAAFIGGDKISLSYHLYRLLLAGGYSVAKIYTDYADEMAFDQKIYVEPVFDPTLTVFDPLAQMSHKGDGRFCTELFPKTADEAKDMYGAEVLKGIKFTRNANIGSFSWSYKNQKEDVMLFAEHFKKKIKKTKILKLANGHSVTEKQYEEFMRKWEAAGIMEQAPIVLKSRMTDIITIDKYTLCASKIVDHKPTNFSMLPLVFFDGNSVIVRDNNESQAEQVTRPYVYQARDAQRMKNFAGQSLCNEIENMVQHKWVAAVEGIPDNEAYKKAYIEPQKANILLFNQFKDNNPDMQIIPPREIIRTPIPPEVTNTFTIADNTIQTILGSYDAAQGDINSDMSGIAIIQGAMHSNAAAMPYTMGFIQGWARLAQCYLNLLPKYYITPRSIPVLKPNGKRDFYEINQPGGKGINFDYDVSALEVEVEPGVNFAVQKQVAMKTLEYLMNVSESFKAFMEQNGLEVILDNIDIRGIDKLRVMAEQWMEQEKAKAAAAQQNQPQDPTMVLGTAQIKLAEQQLATDKEESERKDQIAMTKINAETAIKNKDSDIKFLEVMSKVQGENLDRALEQQNIDAQASKDAVAMVTELSKHINEMEQQNEIQEQEQVEGQQNVPTENAESPQ